MYLLYIWMVEDPIFQTVFFFSCCLFNLSFTILTICMLFCLRFIMHSSCKIVLHIINSNQCWSYYCCVKFSNNFIFLFLSLEYPRFCWGLILFQESVDEWYAMNYDSLTFDALLNLGNLPDFYFYYIIVKSNAMQLLIRNGKEFFIYHWSFMYVAL